MNTQEPVDWIASYGDSLSDRFVDARDVWDASAAAVDSPLDAGNTLQAALHHIEGLNTQARLAVAEQYWAIAEVLWDAASDPSPWVGPDPTLDPAWVDPRDRTVAAVRRERMDIAVRAAAADVAVRLRMSESMVRAWTNNVEVLRHRRPRPPSDRLGRP